MGGYRDEESGSGREVGAEGKYLYWQGLQLERLALRGEDDEILGGDRALSRNIGFEVIDCCELGGFQGQELAAVGDQD